MVYGLTETDGLLRRLDEDDEFSPTCSDYSRLLDLITRKRRISRDEARDLYGGYSYGQWKELLQEE